jgi:ElaB/YqjD/DUF883 family membrane-anchored ribosome-binding protein
MRCITSIFRLDSGRQTHFHAMRFLNSPPVRPGGAARGTSCRFTGSGSSQPGSIFMATSASRTGKPDTDGAKDAAQDLAADIARLRDDMAKLANEIAALGQQSVSTARRAAAEGAEQLRAQGEAAMEGFRANAKDMEQQLTDTVREKPITSLAIAAGVGFLFALLTRR